MAVGETIESITFMPKACIPGLGVAAKKAQSVDSYSDDKSYISRVGLRFRQASQPPMDSHSPSS